uniref:Peptidase M52, hydrogen uptake protein n=1 Tax=Solibacter usitatus (strain Ellin6076) TaxID=234267 RepID=Q01WJ5_SOLUE
MPDTLIIGYGNALRADDGAGYIAAELLRERIHNPAVEVLSMQQLMPELMEPISRAHQVLFIDAAILGRAGSFQRVPLRPAPACSRFTHHATPETLLAGAQSLYGRAPVSLLYTIPGKFFEIGQELTPSVRRAVEALVEELAAVLKMVVAPNGRR